MNSRQTSHGPCFPSRDADHRPAKSIESSRLFRSSYPRGSEMNELLEDVIAAHGGLARWKAFAKVQATIITGGALRGMKGLVPNEHMQTSIDSIFAVGDDNGIALPDSVATAQANVAVQTISWDGVPLISVPKVSVGGRCFPA